MRTNRRFAICTAAVLSMSIVSSLSAAAAEDTLSVDMTDNNDEAWADIAMANDDTVTTGVVVRTSADQNSSVAGYLYRGDAVKVVNKGDTWTEISSGSVKGFVKNDYLTYGTDAKGLAEYYGTYGVEASWNDVNVFASNSSAAEVVSEADDGDTFEYVSTDGHFIEVKDGNDNTVYVSNEDVDPVILLSTASSVNEDSDSSAAAASESSAESTEAPAAEVSEDTSAADTASYDTASYDESSAASYTDTSYEDASADTSYTDSTDDTASDTSYADTSYTDTSAVSETDTSGTDTSYTDTSASADYSFDGSGYSSAQEAANAAYQVYLDAQAAADAAVANGASESEIYSTADAATAAYSTFLQYQNAADAEAAGISSGSTATVSDTSSDTSTDQTAAADTYTETADTGSTADTSSDYTAENEAQTEDTSSSGTTVSSSDLDLLAAVIYCEAGNQPYEGMVAVGAVVMNRVYSSSFPNTISEVLYQSGQFTTAGMLEGVLANGSVPSSCYSAAQDALNGTDPTGGCLYFNTSHGSGVHIGDHWFY